MKPVFQWSASRLVVVTLALVILINNQTLWSVLSERLDLLSFEGFGYLLSFYFLILIVMTVLVLLPGQGILLKPLLISVVLISAILSYFTQQLGVVFDPEMLRNIFDNIRENNHQEALDLVSTKLALHLFIYAVLPTLLVSLVKIKPRSWWKEQSLSLGVISLLLVVTAGLVLGNFKYVTYFSRENRDLRVYITPVFAITSARKLYRKMNPDETPPFVEINDGSRQVSNSPTIGVLVVGETARSDHFSLNGYMRLTNPGLSKRPDVVSYTQAWSCGTATAYSVPCMFSFMSRDNYTPDKAAYQSNVLDLLQDTGVEVYWVENNSGCKGVCDRLEQGRIRRTGEHFDIALLDELDRLLVENHTDKLIVLHMLGSHGPSYYKRFPKEFAAFKPYCTSNTPHDCSNEEIVNSYDNTILYTDYILDQVIARLENYGGRTFMLYASDHGESLGENGIYLHGLPYALAPDAQKHIPMIVWGSQQYLSEQKTAFATSRYKTVSHDYLAHTLLGLYDVMSQVYEKDLDLMSM